MSQGTRDLRKKAPHCVPTQPREKRGSQFLRRPQGRRACLLLQERGWDLGSFWKYDDPLPSQDRLGSLRALKALRGLAPSLSRLFRALHLSQPTGPAPLLGPRLHFPLGSSFGLRLSGHQLWQARLFPSASATPQHVRWSFPTHLQPEMSCLPRDLYHCLLAWIAIYDSHPWGPVWRPPCYSQISVQQSGILMPRRGFGWPSPSM